MQTTIEFLDGLKKAKSITSDYQLAQFLGTTRQQISNYRTGTHTLGDDAALLVARELGITADYVLACMAAERSKGGDAKKAWQRLAKKLAPASVAILVMGCALVAPGQIDGTALLNSAQANTRTVNIMLTLLVLLGLTAVSHFRAVSRTDKARIAT